MSRIMPGGEPFLLPGGRTGCLLVHGFTASPQEVRGLGEHLAGLGHTALGVRLFAHAADINDMLRSHWTDWLGSVEDGYHLLRGLCDQIVVMGVSLGGVLSLMLSASHPVAGVVAMSTPYAPPPDPRMRVARLLAPVVKLIPKGPPDWRDPGAQATRVAYTAYPIRAAQETLRAMAALRACLPRVTAPVLLIHSKEDDFVLPENMDAIRAHLGSGDVETLLIDNSNHVVTLDLARPLVFNAAGAFVARLAAARP